MYYFNQLWEAVEAFKAGNRSTIAVPCDVVDEFLRIAGKSWVSAVKCIGIDFANELVHFQVLKGCYNYTIKKPNYELSDITE